MLPGFRFLFAAIVLSLSILVFGLGAAALLRAAHEQFASLPSRRAPAEPVFTRQNDAPLPTLALLRFDPPAVEKTAGRAGGCGARNGDTGRARCRMPRRRSPKNWPHCRKSRCRPSATPAAPITETAAPTPATVVESAPPPAVAAGGEGRRDRGRAGASKRRRSAGAQERYAVAGSQHRNDQNRHAGWTHCHHRRKGRGKRRRRQAGSQHAPEAGRTARPGATTYRGAARPAGGGATGGAGRSTVTGQPVRANPNHGRAHSAVAFFKGYAGPVAIGGPSGRPHSDHEPS